MKQGSENIQATLRLPALAAVLALFAMAGLQAKSPVQAPEDTPIIGPWDRLLVERMYRHMASEDPDAGLADLMETEAYRQLMQQEPLRLFGGPVLGCVTPHSARLWVRSNGPAAVQAVVSSQPDLRNPIRSDMVRTSAENDFTALLDVSGLKPSSTYYYEIVLDGEPMLGGNEPLCPERPSFRTFPETGKHARFTVGFGGGARYIPENERIWDTIAARSPLAFLLMGDNVYIDQPRNRTRQRVMYYRRQLRPEYRRMAASTAIYAIWDDHDFGDNDCHGGPDPFKPDWKLPVWRVFRENWNNPAYGGGEEQPGCWFDFRIGDVQFFMLDSRYYRTDPGGGNRTMLGPAQKEWLFRELRESDATFKILASPVPWAYGSKPGSSDPWQGYREERAEIFSFLHRNDIGGVVLISADRHRSDVWKIEREEGYDLYEFESSRLTNRHKHREFNEKALFSYNDPQSFGLLAFDTRKDDPTVTYKIYNIDGEHVHTHTLKRSVLSAE